MCQTLALLRELWMDAGFREGVACLQKLVREQWKGEIPFLRDDAFRCQTQDIETAIPYETEVGGGSYGKPGVEEGRVFDGIAVEALGAELEHGRMIIVALGQQETCTSLLNRLSNRISFMQYIMSGV